MEEISKLLVEVLNKKFIRAVVSSPRTKEGIIKIKIRPLEMKGSFVSSLSHLQGHRRSMRIWTRKAPGKNCWNI